MPIRSLSTLIYIVTFNAKILTTWWTVTLGGAGMTLSMTGRLVVGAIYVAMFVAKGATIEMEEA